MRILGAFLVVLLLASACTDGGGQATGSPSPDDEAIPAGPTLAPDAELVWETGTDMPTPRTEVAVTRTGSTVVVAGGFTADGETTDVVEGYNFVTDEWETLTPLPEPLHHTTLVAAGGLVYAIGGYTADGEATDEVWAITLGREEWQSAPKLPTARGALAAAVSDGAIHAVGGATGFTAGGELTGAHEVFDLREREWSEAPDLPDPRDHLAAAGLDGRLYVVGGRKLSLAANTARVDVFADGEWTRAADMPTARGGLAAVAWEGRVFVFGGEEPEGTFGAAELYDPSEDAWQSAPDLPTPRHGLGAAAFDADRIVVVGGGPEPGLSVSGATELLVLRLEEEAGR